MHVRLTLAYDGTDFAGWQAQAPGRGRTVQGVLEEALARLCGAPVAVSGAGRTDAGVHALGQVASLDLPRAIPIATVQRALNGLLPQDVRVREAAECDPDFHARKSALGKHYRYVLDTGPVQLPTRRRLAAHVEAALDRGAVAAAAALFLGTHDFASVASSGGSALTTVRTVTRSLVSFDGSTVVYDVEGNGFLRKMVRSLVGGLVACGKGAMSVEALQQALLARDRGAWPPPAAARGLCLVEVRYPPAAVPGTTSGAAGLR